MAEREWYYAEAGVRRGPISESALLDFIRQGTVVAASLVWTQGMAQWQRVDQAPGLMPAIGDESMARPMVRGGAGVASRPTCLTVLGIINIVFGVFGALCAPIGLISLKIPGMEGLGSGFRMWTIVSVIVGVIASAALILLGIGLLKLKSWARIGNMVYAWFAILWGLAGTALNMTLIMPAMQEGMGGAHAQVMGGMIGGMVFSAIGGIVGLIYPILLLVFMNRQEVRDAFDQASRLHRRTHGLADDSGRP